MTNQLLTFLPEQWLRGRARAVWLTLPQALPNFGNLVIDHRGDLVVTDRNGNRVYRLGSDGSRSIIAGNGSATGGGDGQLATATGLPQVRAIWFLPTGAFFVGTDSGAQMWLVDTQGIIHLFLHGSGSNAHAGDGAWFYKPNERELDPFGRLPAIRKAISW